MTLKNYYRSLPDDTARADFREKIIKQCECADPTVRAWCNGKRSPKANDQKVIARIAGISRTELFNLKRVKQ